ncbi:MAG: FAD-dependent oxidoreductase, partial [Schleiferiaceae bacterium]|nr:FAD-dependent oxidoreductase [Schleiferiaceae bacterium]
SERVYPDVLLFGGLINALTSDTKTYYDAAFRKDSNHHVLGLFSINEEAAQYTNLNSDQERLAYILNELDEIFEGKASQHYIKHSFQNWSQENYIRGSYSYNFDGNQQDMVNTLLTPIDNKLYFAGEALSIDNQATVHGASESAYQVVENLLRS